MVTARREPLPPAAASPAGGRTSAVYALYRAAEVAVGLLPHRAAYRVASVVASALVAVQPRRLDGLRDNLRHVLPGADAADIESIVRANARNVARCWVDVMEMRTRGDQMVASLDVIDGLKHYIDAAGRGRGAVVISMHFGSWESGLASWNRLGGRLALLAEQIEPAALFARIAGGREALGVKVIPIDAAAMRGADGATARRLGAHAMRDVLRHLRAGHTIAIAIDRDITATGERMRFFDADAPIPVGAVDVAIRAGAAIIPIVLLRRRWRTHGYCFPEVTYDVSAPRAQEAQRVTARVLRQFEDMIRNHPEQWHVLDPIWRSEAS